MVERCAYNYVRDKRVIYSCLLATTYLLLTYLSSSQQEEYLHNAAKLTTVGTGGN